MIQECSNFISSRYLHILAVWEPKNLGKWSRDYQFYLKWVFAKIRYQLQGFFTLQNDEQKMSAEQKNAKEYKHRLGFCKKKVFKGSIHLHHIEYNIKSTNDRHLPNDYHLK